MTGTGIYKQVQVDIDKTGRGKNRRVHTCMYRHVKATEDKYRKVQTGSDMCRHVNS